MVTKAREASLVVCLFVFLFVVIGSGLHLTPGGALLAAATGTPLVIHLLHRRWPVKNFERNAASSLPNPGLPLCGVATEVERREVDESETFVQS
jgi:hypothetical protein